MNSIGQLYEKYGDTSSMSYPVDFTFENYFAASVSMPTLKVKNEEFKRDSRANMMPTADESLSEIKIKFLFDAQKDGKSKVLRFLAMWTALVRAGRGQYGSELHVPELDENFRMPCAFTFPIYLLNGASEMTFGSLEKSLQSLSNEYYGVMENVQEELSGLSDETKSKKLSSMLANGGLPPVTFTSLTNDLVVGTTFIVQRAWLASYKVSDLDYSKGNELVTVEATLFAEHIEVNPR